MLKAPLRAGPGPAREAAALRVLAGRPGAPQLLAESIDPPVLVMADLGTGPSLADALLGEDPDAAVAALHGWVDALAGMAVATTGLRPAFEAELAALSPLGPPPTDWCAWAVPDPVADAALARWSEQVRPPAGFGAEIEEAAVGWAFITTSWFLPQILSGGDDGPADRPAPTRRAAIQHRLSRVSRGGPLGDLAAELLAALAREYGDRPLRPAPAFR